MDSSGAIWAWGYGAQGELGNGSNARSSVPVPVSRQNLPPGVTKLQVIEINRKEVRGRPASSQVPPRRPAGGGATKPVAAKPDTPTVPATLDLKIAQSSWAWT